MATQFENGLTLSQLAERNAELVTEVEKLRAERDVSLNAERVWEKTMMEVCGEDSPASVASEIRALRALRDTAMQALKSQVEQLAAENVALKAGASYFSYGSEHNFEWHKTAEKAVEAAEAAIDDYRGDACDGWSDEVDSIFWGIIMQSSTKVGERPRNEDDRCDPAIDTVCDYALLPNIETPATDRIVAGIKADAANQMCVAFVKHKELAGMSDDDLVTVREATDAVLHCAEVISEEAK